MDETTDEELDATEVDVHITSYETLKSRIIAIYFNQKRNKKMHAVFSTIESKVKQKLSKEIEKFKENDHIPGHKLKPLPGYPSVVAYTVLNNKRNPYDMATILAVFARIAIREAGMMPNIVTISDKLKR